jgi:hypothetical protein
MAGGPVPLPSRPMPVADVTPQASAPPATAMSSWRLRRGSSGPSGEHSSRCKPRAASCAATIEPMAATKASSPSAHTSSPAPRAAAYANTPWPLAITTRMAASDPGIHPQRPSRLLLAILVGWLSHPAVGWPALALLAAVAGWSCERRATAAAAERWLAACCSPGRARLLHRHDILRDPCPRGHQRGGAGCTYLSSPLPGLSLPRPPGLSRPPARPLCALPSRLSGRPGGSARWLPEESLPSPEPAARDGGGWLAGGLAASAAPRPGPIATTAVLVWASSAMRPRAVPMRAPTSAPTTTRTWPPRRNDRSTEPPSSNTTLTTLPTPAEPNLGSLSSPYPHDQLAATESGGKRKPAKADRAAGAGRGRRDLMPGVLLFGCGHSQRRGAVDPSSERAVCNRRHQAVRGSHISMGQDPRLTPKVGATASSHPA